MQHTRGVDTISSNTTKALAILPASQVLEYMKNVIYNESDRHHFWARMRSAVSVSPAARSR
jgi:hypothetical protein